MIDLIPYDFKRPVHDGFIRLVDCMPRITESGTADEAIVQAARVSYNRGTKTVSDDRTLIRYLYRNWHTTPFEMVEFKFHAKMPIFVAAQWVRHRTANINQESARYSELASDFYYPEEVRAQSDSNKQGSTGLIDESTFIEQLDNTCALAYERYKAALEEGVAREVARFILPQNIYTEWYWKCDLHNIFNFLRLRCDSHAQLEIREYAWAMSDIVKTICPLAHEAWVDYRFEALSFSRMELQLLKGLLEGVTVTGNAAKALDLGKSETFEMLTKFKKLGMEFENVG